LSKRMVETIERLEVLPLRQSTFKKLSNSHPKFIETSHKTTLVIPDEVSRKWVIDYLHITAPTLRRYREIAYLIPDYIKVSNRIWKIRNGEDYESSRIRAIVHDDDPVGVIDTPPFVKPQVQILQAVKELVVTSGNNYKSVEARVKEQPRIWLQFHTN